MRHHAQRIRRIQALCARLDHTIQDSHAVQQTVEQLKAESGRLLQDLRPRRKQASRPGKKVAGKRVRTKADD